MMAANVRRSDVRRGVRGGGGDEGAGVVLTPKLEPLVSLEVRSRLGGHDLGAGVDGGNGLVFGRAAPAPAPAAARPRAASASPAADADAHRVRRHRRDPRRLPSGLRFRSGDRLARTGGCGSPAAPSDFRLVVFVARRVRGRGLALHAVPPAVVDAEAAVLDDLTPGRAPRARRRVPPMGRLLPLLGIVVVLVVVLLLLLVILLLLDLLLDLPRARRPAPRLLHEPPQRRVPSHHRDALLASLRGARDGRRQLSVDHLQVRSSRHESSVGRLQLLQLLEEELLRLVQARQVRAMVGVVHGLGRHPHRGVRGVAHRRRRRRGLDRVAHPRRRRGSSHRIVFAQPRLSRCLCALAVPGLSVRGLGPGTLGTLGTLVAEIEELVPVVVMRVVVMVVVVVVVVVPTGRLRPNVVVHSLRVLHARLDRE